MAFDYSECVLQEPGSQIRLFHMNQGCDDMEISGSLEAWSFEDCPPYTAMSYRWGDPTPALFVRINNQSVSVTANCSYALWQIRRRGEDRLLWVDSFCIDQSNLKRRSCKWRSWEPSIPALATWPRV